MRKIDPWIAFIGVGMVVLVVTLIAGFAGGGTSEAQSDGGPEPMTVAVELTEFAINGHLTVTPGSTLEIANRGAVAHDFVIDGGPSTALINPGETATLRLGNLAPGTYNVICSVSGHETAGMHTTLTVTEDPEAAASHDDHAHGGEIDYAELDRAMTESMLAFPAETEGIGNQLLEPNVLPDGTKEFELTAEITPWEVEPGKFVDAWTYNGIVPGPMIRVDVGDKVRVVLNNQLPMGTDVHWHGIDTPNSMDGVAPITQPLIESGDTFVYEFVAEDVSVGMYHAHHHAQMQVPNGLFAPFLIGELPLPHGQTVSGIELPDEIEIAHELPMVLNDAGVIGYSLNGKSFPATQPYVVKEGDWLLVHYYNEGLQIHPMHQHQFGQLVVAKDGFPLDEPYFADTVNVAPGERYSVLVHADDPGVWVWHCHILTHVERNEGMFGMVTALIVEENDPA